MSHQDENGGWEHKYTKLDFLAPQLAIGVLNFRLSKDVVDEENEDIDVVNEHHSNEDGYVSLTNGRYDTFDMHMKVAFVGVVVQTTVSVFMPKYAVREFTSLIHWVVVLAQALNVTEEV